MKAPSAKKILRCAIYTRKSTDHNLDLEFNSLDAQREACEAYIKSQAQEGWRLMPKRYDDGAFSGASLDRPALQELLDEVRGSRVDVIVVYKVDRLTRSLADFAKLVELFDQHSVSFVSVTQSFNTTSSMGRLTLNVLLSFAQFEREVIGERVRDNIAASKRKGIWVGGPVPLGYASVDKKLVVVPQEAEQGEVLAQVMLAEMYFLGEGGLRQSFVEAYKWAILAEESGVPEAKIKKMTLEVFMRKTQQQEAIRLAEQWKYEKGSIKEPHRQAKVDPDEEIASQYFVNSKQLLERCISRPRGQI